MCQPPAPARAIRLDGVGAPGGYSALALDERRTTGKSASLPLPAAISSRRWVTGCIQPLARQHLVLLEHAYSAGRLAEILKGT